MDVLLRQLRAAPDGGTEYQDTELRGEGLSLGSAADCTIQLLGERVEAQHATVRARHHELSVTSVRRARVYINGRPVRSAIAKLGDLIEIGAHRLRVLDPPAGFDFALEWEPDPQVAPSAYERAFRTDLSMTWLSRRAAAWILAALILLGALLVPYGGLVRQRSGGHLPPLVPSDQLWSAGPLTPAHQLAAGQRCGSCHQQLFLHVRDATCRECHRGIGDHVQPARLAETQLGPAQRCAQCHQEHHAPVSGLVVRDNGLCVDCHAHSDVRFGALKVHPVEGFSLNTHPAFTVSLLKPAGTADENGQLRWAVSREPVSTAREQSNLKFSHAQHLDPEHVTRASDRGALGCSDCHTLDADGEHFIPITMQRSCSSCHELTFDPQAPDRQLPHGKPRDAILLIQDYFVRNAVAPRAPASGFHRRRMPEEAEPQAACTAAPLECAMKRAQGEIQNQFTGRGCVSCHEVRDQHTSELLDRFQVEPVRLTRDYFPKVHFSHRLHAVQKGKSGDAACLTCHAVKASRRSADLFIPNLSKCLDCHSERLAVDRVTLQCSSCHSYHPITTYDRLREADAQ
jgi:predicted CXXCH cytochrome family protein